MSIFAYKGIDKSGKDIKGNINADNLLQAKQKMRAQGVVAKAEGNAKAIEINALSEALRFKAIIESMVKQEVNPNMAAEVARTIIKTENVRDSKVTTWVDAEGGLKNIFGGQK